MVFGDGKESLERLALSLFLREAMAVCDLTTSGSKTPDCL